jgi:hypothetical protein
MNANARNLQIYEEIQTKKATGGFCFPAGGLDSDLEAHSGGAANGDYPDNNAYYYPHYDRAGQRQRARAVKCHVRTVPHRLGKCKS